MLRAGAHLVPIEEPGGWHAEEGDSAPQSLAILRRHHFEIRDRPAPDLDLDVQLPFQALYGFPEHLSCLRQVTAAVDDCHHDRITGTVVTARHASFNPDREWRWFECVRGAFGSRKKLVVAELLRQPGAQTETPAPTRAPSASLKHVGVNAGENPPGDRIRQCDTHAEPDAGREDDAEHRVDHEPQRKDDGRHVADDGDDDRDARQPLRRWRPRGDNRPEVS